MNSFADVLRATQASQQISQSELAEEVGQSQKWVSDILQGRRDTKWKKAIEVLDKLGWRVRIERKCEDDDVRRRQFTTSVAAMASVIVIPSDRLSSYRDADYVEGLAQHIKQRNFAMGGVTVQRETMHHLVLVERETRDTKDVALLLAASELASQAAIALNDSGGAHIAVRAGHLAADLARRAAGRGHDALARAMGSLCRVLYDHRDYEQSLALAARALRIPDLATEQAARLQIRHARACGRVGYEHGARAGLDQAMSLISDVGGQNRALLVGDIGTGLSELGLESADLIGQAVNGAGDSLRLRCTLMARQIQAQINGPSPERAIPLLITLANALPFVASTRLDKRVREILALVEDRPHGSDLRAAAEHLRLLAAGIK